MLRQWDNWTTAPEIRNMLCCAGKRQGVVSSPNQRVREVNEWHSFPWLAVCVSSDSFSGQLSHPLSVFVSPVKPVPGCLNHSSGSLRRSPTHLFSPCAPPPSPGLPPPPFRLKIGHLIIKQSLRFMGNQLEEEAAWKGLYILAGRVYTAGRSHLY